MGSGASREDQNAPSPGARIVGFEAHEGFLHVRFENAPFASADFHDFWLRHHCDCCCHPDTGERTLCASELPDDLSRGPVEMRERGACLAVTWREGGAEHSSRYPVEWLVRHAYAPDRVAVEAPSSDVSRLLLPPGGAGPSVARAAVERTHGFGAAVLREIGTDTDAVIAAFESLGLQVIPTHFGRIEDLRTDNTTNQNTDQLGYTNAPVELHSDQPFLDEPPRLQLLHCMQPADRGGDSALADAAQAARYLASEDAEAFAHLTTTPVVFHRVQKGFERKLVSPVVELRDSEVFRVRSSYFTMAPHRVPFEQMLGWYRAYNRFARLLADPRHQYRVRLESGDALLYDNFRMLHARTGFEGGRWVRGVYFDWPDDAAGA